MAGNENQLKAAETVRKKKELGKRYQIDIPCPFCGKSKIVIEKVTYSDDDLYIAKCPECYAVTNRANTPEQAIEFWEEKLFPDYIWASNRDGRYVDDLDIWGELKNAIVVSVFDKYKEEKKRAMRYWSNPRTCQVHLELAEIEKAFFYRPHFETLAGISGDKIIEAADKQAKYDVLFRDVNHCRGCGNNDCKHQHYIWWLWDKGNEYDKCPGRKKRTGKKRVKLWTNQHLYPSAPH